MGLHHTLPNEAGAWGGGTLLPGRWTKRSTASRTTSPGLDNQGREVRSSGQGPRRGQLGLCPAVFTQAPRTELPASTAASGSGGGVLRVSPEGPGG